MFSLRGSHHHSLGFGGFKQEFTLTRSSNKAFDFVIHFLDSIIDIARLAVHINDQIICIDVVLTVLENIFEVEKIQDKEKGARFLSHSTVGARR